MVYAFTFLGEFGYELLNWQGVIRKFSQTIKETDRIVCCSRADVAPLYEKACQYINITSVPAFRESVANGYFAVRPGKRGPRSPVNRFHNWRLCRQLRFYIQSQLTTGLAHEPVRFIFSSSELHLNGCVFGCDPQRYAVVPGAGDIYDQLDLHNNLFARIAPDLRDRTAIEGKLGWSLEEPFVLCQTRARTHIARSSDKIPIEQLLNPLASRTKVLLLGFRSGRAQDSFSAFGSAADCARYEASSFREQSCLIHFARRCLFFTEGDFGSHIYVPPLLGKDVTAIAARSVYAVGTTPVDFWNRNVFRFGGQIIAQKSEDVFATESGLQKTIDELLA